VVQRLALKITFDTSVPTELHDSVSWLVHRCIKAALGPPRSLLTKKPGVDPCKRDLSDEDLITLVLTYTQDTCHVGVKDDSETSEKNHSH